MSDQDPVTVQPITTDDREPDPQTVAPMITDDEDAKSSGFPQVVNPQVTD